MGKEPEFWEEKLQTGEVVSRDPRVVTRDEMTRLGHLPMSPIKAIRARCLDCCAGQIQEVRYCTARKCPSWPFRMGTDFWREKKVLTEEQRAKLKDQLDAARTRRRVPVAKETPE